MIQRSNAFIASNLDEKYASLINSYLPYKTYALEIHPDTWNNHHITSNRLADIIEADVRRFDWHISSTNGGLVIVEPNHTARREIPPASSLFHVAPKRLRSTIRSQGLIPSTGGRTHLKRRHPPRVYLALTLADARTFTQNRIANRPSQAGRPTTMDFDIWRVKPDRRRYHDDLRFHGKGVWCAEGIPPTAIRLLFR